MQAPLRLMSILAHPDDETLGMGGTLAKYAADGVETHLLLATRGEKGWKDGPHPGATEVARHRTGEVQAAARALGVRDVTFLDYPDGGLDRADAGDAVARIAARIARVRPQVVVTFGPDGVYGHEDHVAISQLATAAVMRSAADPDGHRVDKLYYLAFTRAAVQAYQEVFGPLRRLLDGAERRFCGWEEWQVSARLDTRVCVSAVRRAVGCHRSQLRDPDGLLALPDPVWERVFGEQTFYRASSLVNGGREVEDDLFAGLR
jgi:LmbE family N-acetylglucosaminyl deacetylase